MNRQNINRAQITQNMNNLKQKIRETKAQIQRLQQQQTQRGVPIW